MLNELRKLENELIGWLKDEEIQFLNAIKEYDRNELSKEVIDIINAINKLR